MRLWPVVLKALAAWPIVVIAWGVRSERSQSKKTMYEVAWGGGGGGAWTACGSLQAPRSKAAPTTAIDGLSMFPLRNESSMWRSENARPEQKDATPGFRGDQFFLAGEDPADHGRHLVGRFQRHMRAHRQAEYGIGQSLGQGIGALHLSEIGIGGLQMRRDRIVDQRADPGLLQRLHELGPAGGAHDVEMPDGLRPLRGARHAEAWNTSKLIVIAGSDAPTALVPDVEMAELDAQEGGLQLVEPRIVAALEVHVLHAAAVVAQHTQALGERSIVSRDRAAI